MLSRGVIYFNDIPCYSDVTGHSWWNRASKSAKDRNGVLLNIHVLYCFTTYTYMLTGRSIRLLPPRACAPPPQKKISTYFPRAMFSGNRFWGR